MARRVYSRAFASVRFMSPKLAPLTITNLLGLPADHQHRFGERRLVRTATGRINEYAPYSSGQWSMSSESWVQSTKLETHLIWLLVQLEPHAEAIHAIDIPDLKTDFFCYSAGATPAKPAISESVTRRARALGISIDIDHYDTSDDGNPA